MKKRQKSEHPDAVLDRIAAGQHGVVARRQLVDAGIGRRAIDRLLSSGRLHLLHRGVYRVGPLVSPHAAAMGAILACGGEAVVSHRTAGAIWGCVTASPDMRPTDVTVPRSTRRRITGVATHRTRSLASADVTYHEMLPVTTPVRTLMDLAVVLPASELERVIGKAERNGLVQASEILDRARVALPHPGATRIRKLLEAEGAASLTRSDAESRLLDIIRRGRLRRPRVNAPLHGYEVDFLWDAERLVVEVDGFAFHASQRSFTRDRRRDAALIAAGYRVIRFTWDDISRYPEPTLVNLAQALAR